FSPVANNPRLNWGENVRLENLPKPHCRVGRRDLVPLGGTPRPAVAGVADHPLQNTEVSLFASKPPDLLPSTGRADTACDYCCEPPGSVRFLPVCQLGNRTPPATSSKALAIASSLTEPATRL